MGHDLCDGGTEPLSAHLPLMPSRRRRPGKAHPEIGSIQRSGEDPAKRDFLLENDRRYKKETKSHGEGAVWGRDHSASGGIENAVAIDDPIRESFGEPTEPGRRAGRTLRS